MSTDSSADEKWSAYGHTVLEFPGPPPLSIDLRRPLRDEDRDALRTLGLDAPFAVLTAENPSGENTDDAPSEREAERREERNERRTSRLERSLERSGTRFVLVDGVAPDGSYRERCVAMVAPQEDAVRLARELEQLALFWFDGRDFWLLPAEANEPPERLPRTAESASG